MDPTRSVPPELRDQAYAFLAGEVTVVPARGSSTVVLLRESPDGPEVYLLRRHARMAFAPGMYAFPGGTVDPRDRDQLVAWAGPSVGAWAQRLDCDEGDARAFVCAAVRETFEESGVLLAGATAESVVADTTGADWEADRRALISRDLSLTHFLDRRGLVLRTDLLSAWAHWVTPEFQPRRYDTRFFVAMVPPGQRPRDVSGEADTVVWMRPGDAVSEVHDETMRMLAPTYVTLQEMTRFATADTALAAAGQREITTIMPRVEVVDDDLVFTGAESAGG